MNLLYQLVCQPIDQKGSNGHWNVLFVGFLGIWRSLSLIICSPRPEIDAEVREFITKGRKYSYQ
jgi:hypothetical protein